MDVKRLELVMGLKFCTDAENLDLEQLQQLYPMAEEVTEVDYKRAIFMNDLRRRSFEGRVIGYVDKTKDMYGIIFNWCIIYSRLWELEASWSRFVECSEKHDYKNVTQVPLWKHLQAMDNDQALGWKEHVKEYFDFIFNMVDQQGLVWLPRREQPVVQTA